MNSEQQDFILDQYRALWREAGVEAVLNAPKRAQPKKLPTPKGLPEIQQWLGDCTRCKLCKTRNKIVFGSGNPKADLMFVGEGPGADEDAQGLPFVGRAGQLLTKIIEAMGMKREEVYIANIVKCRPPNNRVPEPDEVAACSPFLMAQVNVIKPKVIVALGATATKMLLKNDSPMSAVRGRFQNLSWLTKSTVMPTYHPAYLLRNPPAKKIVWDDMKLVMKELGAAGS